MVDIIKDTVDKKQLKDLRDTKESVVKTEPKITKTKVNNAIRFLKDIENNNGFLSIAQTVGLSQKQVRKVHREMLRRIAELTPEPEEDVPGTPPRPKKDIVTKK